MVNRRVVLLLLVLCLIPISQAPPALAATIAVTTTADELSTNGQCSLREAIRNANADSALHPDCLAGSGADRISVPAGTYTLTLPGRGENAAATGDLDLTGAVELTGNSASSTIIEAGPDGGGRIDRVFDVKAGATVTISGVTVRRGNPGQNASLDEASGGGIRSAGDLTVSDAVIRDNTVSSVTLLTTVPNADGGGIYVSYTAPGALTVRRTTITGNSANLDGGGVTFTPGSGTAIFDAVTISGNTARSGGGLDLDRGTVTVTNSTISGNQATQVGGGVGNEGAALTISSSTIVRNSAPRGSGIDQNTNNSIILRATIVENTGSPNCFYNTPAAAFSQGSNISSDSSCKFDASSDLNNTNPLLGALADNGGPTQTHALLAGSPAIDAVQEPCPPEAADQRGVSRPLDGNGDGTARCDIGAYEAPVVLPPTATPTLTPTSAPSPSASTTVTPTLTPTATPTPTPEPARGSADDDQTVRSNRKPSEDVQRQQERTNQGNRDDAFTEGNVLEVHVDAVPPYIVVANRDGPVIVQLFGEAAQSGSAVRVGDYVEVEGVKQHESLFDADSLSISR